ncbi:MAG: hypothetical protein GWN00_18370, partial [Aliifodinibius sp.]|nr:hypothetical protein [Fodinibius sp.]NIV13033.1 hypothetical protein [Fodinibius sp.]NIY26698.1 hypothetical protein [Fodinibius sp.]
GNARIEFRIPVNDFQEDKLRSKIQSKMSVSTFLAGFTFAALIGLLTKTSGDFTILQMVSAIGLTFSLALFIAAIYMYDRLSMPEGFWVYDDRPTT